jgi:GH18 family chitinase
MKISKIAKSCALFLPMLASSIGISYAACSAIEKKSGWTGEIQFQCDTKTDLLNNPITFKVSNDVQVTSVWGLPGKTEFQQNGDTVSVTVSKWWPEGQAFEIDANSIARLSFSPSSSDFEISNFQIGEAQEKLSATISINLPAAPAGVNDEKATVDIYNGSIKVSEIKDHNWNAEVNIPVQFYSNNASFHIVVANIGNNKSIVTPDSFSLTENESKKVEISYQAEAPILYGNIDVSLSASGSTPQYSPSYKLKDANGEIVKSGTLNFNSSNLLDNLETQEEGENYTLELDDFVINGFSYSTLASQIVSVKPNATAPIKVTYTAQQLPSEKVGFTVTGLPDSTTSTLIMTSSTGETEEVDVTKNGTYSLEIPKDDTNWTISASSVTSNGIVYTNTITPSLITANSESTQVTVSFQEKKLVKQFITGYWENWKNNDPTIITQNFNRVMYSFLTLDSNPNPDSPQEKGWDGVALYETMTLADVNDVIKNVEPAWDNPHNWQKIKIDALQNAVKINGGKFIWAIGGWSDLTKTISKEQIPMFVEKVVTLLKSSGDGVDFDWEHIGQDSNIKQEQLETFAETLLQLRIALDAAGLQDKEIGYTTRFNAFWSSEDRPEGFAEFGSDGEGLIVEQYLQSKGSSLNKVVDWVNIMAYDVAPEQIANNGWTVDTYALVFDSFSKYLNKDKIVMGFEPGGQAANGVWEGMETDKNIIDHVSENNYGGVMFWAINEPGFNSPIPTGDNSQELAGYAKSKFS